MTGLCLAAGLLTAVVPAQHFTLAWMHSIEKVRWEEDWQVRPAALQLTAARILGTGAGMEPPPDARLENGVWHYTPTLPPQRQIHLAHSPYTPGYELCRHGDCVPLASLLPGIDNTAVITLSACETPP